MDGPLGHKSRPLLEEMEDRFLQAYFKNGLDFFRLATVPGSDLTVSSQSFSSVDFLQHLYSSILTSNKDEG